MANVKQGVANWLRHKLMVKKEMISMRPGKFSEREIEYAFLFNNLHHSPGPKVLEVAPGKSGMTLPLQHCGYDVTAIDMDVAHPWVHQGDATQLQYEDNSFDAACSISVYEHIPDVDKAMSELFRVVVPGGIIILSFPYNAEQFVPDIYEHIDPDGYIVAIYSEQKLREWFDNRAEMLARDYWKQWDGELFGQGEKLKGMNGKYIRTFRSNQKEAQGICVCVRKLK